MVVIERAAHETGSRPVVPDQRLRGAHGVHGRARSVAPATAARKAHGDVTAGGGCRESRAAAAAPETIIATTTTTTTAASTVAAQTQRQRGVQRTATVDSQPSTVAEEAWRDTIATMKVGYSDAASAVASAPRASASSRRGACG